MRGMDREIAAIMERIIVATDFSTGARAGVEHALRIAERTGCEVVFAHVIGNKELDDSTAVNEWLDELCALGEQWEIPCSTQISRGRPGQQIANLALETGASMVAIGSRGHTGIERFLLGSVAEDVSRLVPCDVLVARGPAPHGGYGRILVPTDFSTAAERALDRAIELAGKPASIELLHCWQPPAAILARPETQLRLEREKILAEATRQAASLIDDRAVDDLVDVSFDTERGHPAAIIQDKLAEGERDLVVMGSHGRSGVRRFFPGSVASKTIRHSPCSVLVVH